MDTFNCNLRYLKAGKNVEDTDTFEMASTDTKPIVSQDNEGDDEKETTCTDRSFVALDTLWACFVLFPVTLSYWRGAWSLLDYYFVGAFVNQLNASNLPDGYTYTAPEGSSHDAPTYMYLLGIPGTYVLLMGIGYLFIVTICVLPFIKRSLDDAGTLKFVICTMVCHSLLTKMCRYKTNMG